MATVKLFEHDLAEDRCPRVCVFCGAESSQFRPVTVSHIARTQAAAGCALHLLLHLILGATLAGVRTLDDPVKTARVILPVCPRHARPPRRRAGVRILARVLGGLLFLLFVGLLLQEFVPPNYPVAGLCFLAAVLVVLGGLVAWVVHDRRGIDALEITGQYVVLTRVSPAFADAVEIRAKADWQARLARWGRKDTEPPAAGG